MGFFKFLSEVETEIKKGVTPIQQNETDKKLAETKYTKVNITESHSWTSKNENKLIISYNLQALKETAIWENDNILPGGFWDEFFIILDKEIKKHSAKELNSQKTLIEQQLYAELNKTIKFTAMGIKIQKIKITKIENLTEKEKEVTPIQQNETDKKLAETKYTKVNITEYCSGISKNENKLIISYNLQALKETAIWGNGNGLPTGFWDEFFIILDKEIKKHSAKELNSQKTLFEQQLYAELNKLIKFATMGVKIQKIKITKIENLTEREREKEIQRRKKDIELQIKKQKQNAKEREKQEAKEEKIKKEQEKIAKEKEEKEDEDKEEAKQLLQKLTNVMPLIDGFIERLPKNYNLKTDVREILIENLNDYTDYIADKDMLEDLYSKTGYEYDHREYDKLLKILNKKKQQELNLDKIAMVIDLRIDQIHEKRIAVAIKYEKDYSKILNKYIKYFGETGFEVLNFRMLIYYLVRNHIEPRFGEGPGEVVIWVRDLLKDLEETYEKIELEEFENKLLNGNKTSLTDLDKLKGIEFEKALGQIFKTQGYTVQETPASNDYGADLLLEKFGRKIAVQAKRYEGTVPNRAIQEAHTAKEYYDCDEAWIVTQSNLSNNSTKMANKLKVKIIDRQQLQKMI